LQFALPPGSVFHHSPNEGKHHVRYRTKLQKLGLRAGWPDLELLVPIDYWFDPAWGPIYFEIKNDKGKLTKHQKNVLAQLDAAGGHTAVVRSIDESREYLSKRVELRA
tara:strand:+ start:580 stop:903 length:324 start_codon:yes stop_codon:yes gene_type:complete